MVGERGSGDVVVSLRCLVIQPAAREQRSDIGVGAFELAEQCHRFLVAAFREKRLPEMCWTSRSGRIRS